MIRTSLALALALAPAAARAQAIAPGAWDVRSTAVDLVLPGVPKFLLRMMKGESRSEHKCIAPDQAAAGVTALLVPDPKAKCRIESEQVANGRLAQVLICPQKDGRRFRLVRSGTYDASGFVARTTMAGETAKGPMNVVLDQRAVRTGPTCRK